jgi:hypothetical protein
MRHCPARQTRNFTRQVQICSVVYPKTEMIRVWRQVAFAPRSTGIARSDRIKVQGFADLQFHAVANVP